MADMYSKIEQLCKENNTNITAMCRLLDISRSTLSELKAGRTKTLSAEYTTKIASYFHVSVDYLLGNHSKETLRLYQLKNCHLMTLPMQCTMKEKN